MYRELFDSQTCSDLFPREKTNQFFEALFGDALEGAYDIELRFASGTAAEIRFDLLLHQRPGHCLACNLTLGLPEVFSRHPIIGVPDLVEQIDQRLGDRAHTRTWKLGPTEQRSDSLHAIPLTISLA